MDPQRKLWNQRQGELRRLLVDPASHAQAIELFLSQHAMLHAGVMTASSQLTFEDELWQDLDEEEARRVPPGGEHSVAWIIWHLARIEDVTMNLLVAGSPQVLVHEGWQERLLVDRRDTGNLIEREEVLRLSASVDIHALREYRLAVGRRTRAIAAQLQAADLKRKVDPARLAQVRAKEAVVEAASDLLKYWGSLSVAGLLLMPPTRHCFVHLNEGLRLKSALKRSRSQPYSAGD